MKLCYPAQLLSKGSTLIFVWRVVRQMLVQWSSLDAAHPVVRWGAAAKALNRTTPADSDSYGLDDMCGPPATTAGWLEPGLLHRALLTDLQPDAEYWYKYGDEVRLLRPDAPGPVVLVGALSAAAIFEGGAVGCWQMR